MPARTPPSVPSDPNAEPFDPEIDPSTLAPPAPAVPLEPPPESPAELRDYPRTAAIPPDRQAIPDDLALPAGTVLAYQDGREWVDVELQRDAPPRDASGGDAALRVHRTDRPAVIPDVRIPRDQLVISRLTVRRLRNPR